MVDENITAEQNLERRLGELEAIVSLLEDGSISINEAIAKYSEGMNIALECQRNLNLLAGKVSQAREEAQRAFNRLKQEEAQEQAEWMSKQQAEQNQQMGTMPLTHTAGGVPQRDSSPQGGSQGAFKMPPNNQMLGAVGPMQGMQGTAPIPQSPYGASLQGMPQGQQGQPMAPQGMQSPQSSQGIAPQAQQPQQSPLGAGPQGGFQTHSSMGNSAASNYNPYQQQGAWGAQQQQSQPQPQQQQHPDNSRNDFGGAPSSDSDVPF